MTDMDIKRDVVAYIENMPSLPTSVSKVLEIANDPQTSPADLNKVISLDPVLMGKVLKLINSAYYSLPNKITSLVRAIIMLGVNTVKNLALSTAVLDNVGRSSDFRALDANAFWRHSIAVGAAAKLIAAHRSVDSKSREEYFISGLLQDVGKILLNACADTAYLEAMQLAEHERIPLADAERQTLGMTHVDAGLLVIDTWNIRGAVRDATAYQYRPLDYDGENREIVLTIATAKHFVCSNDIGFAGDRHPGRFDDATLSELGIDWDLLDTIEEEVESRIEQAQIFLHVAD